MTRYTLNRREDYAMSAQLNHTIVWCQNKHISATFLVEILGLPPPEPFGPMLIVKLDNGVSLDYYDITIDNAIGSVSTYSARLEW